MNARANNMIENARQDWPQPLLRIPDPSANACSSKVRHGLRSQAGSMLLESFIAILIFSMGILAIVGMQTSAIKNSADAKYRSEASLLANELLGKMWVSSDRTSTNPAQVALTLQANFQGGAGTDGPAYTAWYSSWCSTVTPVLPACDAYVPTVSVDPVSSLVILTMRWKAPSESLSTAAHSYAVTAQIR